MKTTRTLTLLAIGVGLAINGHAQSFLTNGLIAYYPFNGNANDASGNGLHGTVYGATLTMDRFGATNKAYFFGGTAHITVPMNSAIFGSDFTASVWFNAQDIANSWPTILDEAGNSAFRMGIVGQTSGAFPQSIGNLYAYATHAQPNKDWELLPQFKPSLNKYYQVVVVRAGTNVRMYLNGELIATNQVVNPTVQPGSTLFIGKEQYDLGGSGLTVFHGVIDDIRIYNRALSASEVQQLYAYESGPRVALLKAVKPAFNNLTVGVKYQMQVSLDLTTWYNQGLPFTATATDMVCPWYYDVDSWSQLYFRLQVVP